MHAHLKPPSYAPWRTAHSYGCQDRSRERQRSSAALELCECMARGGVHSYTADCVEVERDSAAAPVSSCESVPRPPRSAYPTPAHLRNFVVQLKYLTVIISFSHAHPFNDSSCDCAVVHCNRGFEIICWLLSKKHQMIYN